MAESAIIGKRVSELKEASSNLKSLIDSYLDRVDSAFETEFSPEDALLKYEEIVSAFQTVKESAEAIHIGGLAPTRQIGTPTSMQDTNGTDLPAYTDMMAEMPQLESSVDIRKQILDAGIQLTAAKSKLI